jgi:transposase-like protein
MNTNYKNRTQKDYSLSLKLQIVQEIEQGLLTTTGALEKYGVQAASTVRTWLKNMVNLTINIQFKKRC